MDTLILDKDMYPYVKRYGNSGFSDYRKLNDKLCLLELGMV